MSGGLFFSVRVRPFPHPGMSARSVMSGDKKERRPDGMRRSLFLPVQVLLPGIEENILPRAAGPEIHVRPGKRTQPDAVAHHRQFSLADHTFPVDVNRRSVVIDDDHKISGPVDGVFPVAVCPIGKVIAVPEAGEINHAVHADRSQQVVGIPAPDVEHQPASGFEIVRGEGSGIPGNIRGKDETVRVFEGDPLVPSDLRPLVRIVAPIGGITVSGGNDTVFIQLLEHGMKSLIRLFRDILRMDRMDHSEGGDQTNRSKNCKQYFV